MNVSKSPRNFVAEHIAGLPKSGIRKFFDLVTQMDDVISLGVGEPDFATPWTIRESGIYSIERGRTSYTANLGMPALRKAVCSYVADKFNVNYNSKNECIITVGVSEAVDLVIRAITSPGDEIIYSEPCYVSYPAEISMAHGVPVPVTTKKENLFALDPADVERAITPRTKAILINFPCNPTGAVMNRKQLEDIADIAKKHDLLVLSDEIYSELTYDTEHVSIASIPGMKERTVFLHGFSKAFAMTGWRIGYACGPAEIIDAMMKIHQYSIMCAPTMAQAAALEALQNGHGEMEKMRESYRSRRDFFVRKLNAAGLPCHLPQGAFYAFCEVGHTGLDCEEFARKLLQEKHVAIVPGTAFGPGGAGFCRCSYATGFAELEEAARRISEFIKESGF